MMQAIFRCAAQVRHLVDLRRYARLLHEGAGHVLEQRLQVHFLLVVRAERRARLLADDGEHRGVIQPRIVEAVQQVDRTGA